MHTLHTRLSFSYFCFKYLKILCEKVPVASSIGRLRNWSQTWCFVAPAAARITGYLLLLCFPVKTLRLLSAEATFLPHCSLSESTALLWQTERWKSQRGKSGDSASRWRGLKCLGFFVGFFAFLVEEGAQEGLREDWVGKLEAYAERWKQCEIVKATLVSPLEQLSPRKAAVSKQV